MKTHTLRGQVQEGKIKRLIVDDGRLTHGMRVTKFVVCGDPTSSANDCFAVLGYQGNFPASSIFDWSDNNQIAWASSNITSTAGIDAPFSNIDVNHIILRDLYILGRVSTGTGSDLINYYIEMEAVDISLDESIIQLIKERSQGELRA